MNTTKRVWLGAMALAGLAMGANAQIVNTLHNFSTYGWAGNEICKPCHTPHFANNQGELWNHEASSATSYILFGGATGTSADLDEVSRLCMGCHDGTTAIDSFGGATGTTFINAVANVGTDLSNDHPIGSEAVYPTGTSTSFNPQNASHQIPGTYGNLRLYQWTDPANVVQYTVGCKTCHNPHGVTGVPTLLRFSNASSHLCLTCHIK